MTDVILFWQESCFGCTCKSALKNLAQNPTIWIVKIWWWFLANYVTDVILFWQVSCFSRAYIEEVQTGWRKTDKPICLFLELVILNWLASYQHSFRQTHLFVFLHVALLLIIKCDRWDAKRCCEAQAGWRKTDNRICLRILDNLDCQDLMLFS